MRAGQEQPVTTIDVPDGDAPSAETIAARIELGSAEYHESCCYWSLWSNDASLFTSMPACNCGGPAMARAYVELRRLVEQIAVDFGPDEGYRSGWRRDGADLGFAAREALDGR